MAEQVEAIYEGGVLKPLGKPDLREGEVVRLIVIGKSRILKHAGVLKDVPDKEIEEVLREVG